VIETGAIPVIEFNEPATIRLVSTAYLEEPAMSPLADSADELGFLEDIEGLTSARRGFQAPLPGGVRPEELLSEHDGYGWSYVNAAFCYTRPTGNRFNWPERGAWYAAWGANAVKTAHAEVSWHLTRELEATGVYENVTAYRELIAGFTVRFHDLRAFQGETLFDPDPVKGYPAGQALARELFLAGSQGVIYRSVRMARGRMAKGRMSEGYGAKGHGAGQCLAAFRPHVVQNVRQGDSWEFTWTGAPRPAIRKLETPSS
jgi:hypothetical protein